MRINGIVAAVIHKISREHSDAYRLQKLRNQKNRYNDAVDAHSPVGELKQSRQGLAEFLRKLNGGFLALGGERSYVQRVVEEHRVGHVAALDASKAGLKVAQRGALLNGRIKSTRRDRMTKP